MAQQVVEEGSGLPAPGTPSVQDKSCEGWARVAIVLSSLPSSNGLLRSGNDELLGRIDTGDIQVDIATLGRNCDIQASLSLCSAPLDDSLLLLCCKPMLLEPLVEGISDSIMSAHNPTPEGTSASMAATVA